MAEEPIALEFAAELEGPFLISAVSLYELLAGETDSGRIRRVQSLAGEFAVVAAGYEVCSLAALIQTQLLARGRPIPKFDSILAATAILAEVPLVARDRHFAWIPPEFGFRVRTYRMGN